jgi:hypothetical protein
VAFENALDVRNWHIHVFLWHNAWHNHVAARELRFVLADIKYAVKKCNMPVKISNFARPVQNRKYAGSTTPKYAAKERFRRSVYSRQQMFLS